MSSLQPHTELHPKWTTSWWNPCTPTICKWYTSKAYRQDSNLRGADEQVLVAQPPTQTPAITTPCTLHTNRSIPGDATKQVATTPSLPAFRNTPTYVSKDAKQMSTVVDDVTERKKLLKNLKATENKLSKVESELEQTRKRLATAKAYIVKMENKCKQQEDSNIILGSKILILESDLPTQSQTSQP